MGGADHDLGGQRGDTLDDCLATEATPCGCGTVPKRHIPRATEQRIAGCLGADATASALLNDRSGGRVERTGICCIARNALGHAHDPWPSVFVRSGWIREEDRCWGGRWIVSTSSEPI